MSDILFNTETDGLKNFRLQFFVGIYKVDPELHLNRLQPDQHKDRTGLICGCKFVNNL